MPNLLMIAGLLATAACTGATTTGAGSEGGTTGTGGQAGSSAGGRAGVPDPGPRGGEGGSAGASTGGSGGSAVAGSGGSAVAGSGGSGAAGSGGSASSDASIADSGTSSGGAEAGQSAASGCAGKTYKLCEDFESGTAGQIPTGWTTLRGFGAQAGGAALASDQFHSGNMALKSNSMIRGQERVQRSLADLGPTTTKHWGRIFYKVQSPPPMPANGVIHLTFAALQGTTENRVVDTVINTAGRHQWLFNIPDDSCCAGTPYNWTFDGTWQCAEWNIDVATQSFRFYADGQEVTQLAFTGRTGARMSNYRSLGLGAIFYQVPPAPVVVWFDDLAIDDNRIGCQ